MSAISFGLAATAILISMFLIMAILEHLIIPRLSFLHSRSNAQGSLEMGRAIARIQAHEKAQNSLPSETRDFPDVFVLMPGQQYPTFIAQPTLLPCQREGVCPAL